MKICICGAGAIGGYLGVQLALAGEDIALIARGPHLEAMQKNGLKTPAIDLVLALVQQRARVAGCY